MDFVGELPYELSFHIFAYLSHEEVITCMLVCKKWYELAIHPLLWKRLYLQQGWTVNPKYIYHYEEWIKQKAFHLDEEIKQVKKRVLEPALEPALDSTRSNIPFRATHVTILNHTEILLNWRFLYHQRYQLLKNWEKGLYVCYTVPRTQAAGQNEMHQNGIYCIQSDRNWIVSGSKDTTIRVWDLQKGVCSKVLRGHHASVLTLQFDTEMNLIVSGSSDTLVIIWDLSSGKIRSIYRGHTDSVLGLCFDSKHIVTCSKDCTIRVWHHVDHEKKGNRDYVQAFRGHRAAVNAVQLKEDQIVSAGGDRTIRIWNIYTGVCLRTIMGHQRGIACLQFDGRHILSGSSDHLVRLFDAHSGKVLRTFKGHLDLVRTIRYNSHKIVSGSYDETICIWDLLSGKMIHKIKNKESGRIHHIAFDDIRIISCGQKNHIIVYDFGYNVDTTFF
ncbi:hypothetical protein PCK2_000670 [Pneumocystis canis]|nr:hypothetical protein PCK2_000670 [Pneumocystis canis]